MLSNQSKKYRLSSNLKKVTIFMKHASKILFLISTFYNHFGYTQQIINFFNNACTFYYEDPLYVKGVYCLIKGESEYTQKVSLLLDDQVVTEPDNDNLNPVIDDTNDNPIIIKKFTYFLKKPLLFGVFAGHNLKSNTPSQEAAGHAKKVSQYVAEKVKELFNIEKEKDIKEILKEVNAQLLCPKTEERSNVLKNKFAQTEGSSVCLLRINLNGTSTLYNLGNTGGIWGSNQDNKTKAHDSNNIEEINRLKTIGNIRTAQENKFFFISNQGKLGFSDVTRGLGYFTLSKCNKDEERAFIIDEAEEYPINSSKIILIGSHACFDNTESEKIYTLNTKPEKIYSLCEKSLKK